MIRQKINALKLALLAASVAVVSSPVFAAAPTAPAATDYVTYVEALGVTLIAVATAVVFVKFGMKGIKMVARAF